jgi:hypothetical protein
LPNLYNEFRPHQIYFLSVSQKGNRRGSYITRSHSYYSSGPVAPNFPAQIPLTVRAMLPKSLRGYKLYTLRTEAYGDHNYFQSLTCCSFSSFGFICEVALLDCFGLSPSPHSRPSKVLVCRNQDGCLDELIFVNSDGCLYGISVTPSTLLSYHHVESQKHRYIDARAPRAHPHSPTHARSPRCCTAC